MSNFNNFRLYKANSFFRLDREKLENVQLISRTKQKNIIKMEPIVVVDKKSVEENLPTNKCDNQIINLPRSKLKIDKKISKLSLKPIKLNEVKIDSCNGFWHFTRQSFIPSSTCQNFYNSLNNNTSTFNRNSLDNADKKKEEINLMKTCIHSDSKFTNPNIKAFKDKANCSTSFNHFKFQPIHNKLIYINDSLIAGNKQIKEDFKSPLMKNNEEIKFEEKHVIKKSYLKRILFNQINFND